MGVTSALPWSRPLTYDDLRTLPDDGHRYELVDGSLIVTPAPKTKHQSVVGNLYRVLVDAAPPDSQVLFAPVDVVLSDQTVLQPDIVVARRRDVGEDNLRVPPLLAVEVLSPSTRAIDTGTKRLALAAAGVPSYWLVDPDEPSLVALELAGDAYLEVARVAGDESYEATAPFAVRVVPATLLR